ncbi:MAG TPA: cytochrome c [Candidatus Didemnitutus sp.]|nr:cytochrome c [Candidatus Didemnitutus sp.]
MSDDHSFVEQSGASDDSLQQVHAHMHENKPEKPQGYAAFPLVMLGVMCSLIFFSSIYLAHYSAHFDSLIFNEHQQPTKSGPVVVELTPVQRGKKVFNTICIVCHQATGQGVPGTYPPLAGSEWAQGDEQRIIRIVIDGLNGPIHVENKDFNNAMAPLGSTLRDEQIADVLTYVRQEWGNKAPAVEAETVTKVRAAIAGHAGPFTSEELLKIGK